MGDRASSGRATSVGRAHGLIVASNGTLPGLGAAPRDAVPDLFVRWCGVSHVGRGVPDGVPILRHDIGGEPRCAASVDGAVHILRFAECCEFAFDGDAGTVAGRLHPGVNPEIGGILAAGALLAFVLTVRGVTVLHASAVQAPAGAVALVGASGAGKSTTAALLCAAGFPLLADDVLRLDIEPTTVVAREGSTALRLRPKAWDIVGMVPTPATVTDTVDGRRAVGTASVGTDAIPLTAICTPRPRRDVTEVAVRRLASDEAFLRLLATPRFPGWQAQDLMRRWFADMGNLSQRVPMYELDIPWGPPFPLSVVSSLREAVVRIAAVEPSAVAGVP